MERELSFGGTISPCKCGKQPRLIHSSGKDIYYVQCPSCKIRLWDELTAGAAVGVWEFLAQYHDTENMLQESGAAA